MGKNVGSADKIVRIVIGLALLWYALLAAPTGWNWIGWLGIIPLVTAVVGVCPLYSILGVSTCPAKKA
jgi:hypothetical protein